MKPFRLVLAGLALCSAPTSAFSVASEYDAQKADAIRKCEAVDGREYQSGLYFNPDGYRSYYMRSLCFQETAVTFRDVELCERVRQRRALLSSSWGYSKSNCRKLVGRGVGKDRETIDAMREAYAQGHVRLAGFRVERDGNGRDIDIIPEFSGEGAHAYELRFELVPAGDKAAPVLLDASGFHLAGASDSIRLYVRAADMRRRFPEFALGQYFTVRATLTYAVGTGSYQGRWSPDFIESRFPEARRTQTLTREVRF
jgi:hypothetical protein